MAGGRPPLFRSFVCPNCQAMYQIVKGEAGPETVDREVAAGSVMRHSLTAKTVSF
jgi:hypothetical protein